MIRVATMADIGAISDIRTRSWQFIYRGHMPDAFLDGIDARASDERWRVMIDGTTPRSCILVTDESGPVTGFIALEPASDLHFGYEGYLSALYLDPGLIGRGLGRALFEAGCGWMRKTGYADMFWWVIAANWRALAFYEKMGATRVPGSLRAFDPGGGVMDEHAYGMRL